ncbi:hypothetical protein AP058_00615 [Flavobacterium sp. TAB 87]|nr:hypothetical protein AP058_00615 [Flavobacterium sp. TAB 87]
MIYMHTINTSLESNYENDDDVLDLKTLLVDFLFFDSVANIQVIFLKRLFLI